jgi:hypothetical protein
MMDWLDDLMDSSLMAVVVILVILCVIITGGIVAISAINIAINHIQVRVVVDGREVYHGINACVSIYSGGATTEVRVWHGRLCMWPAAAYVSRDVHVEGDLR